MTAETPSLPLPSGRAAETRVIAGIGAAHLVSHFYFLLLPPVLLWVRRDYGVTYTELGVCIAAFNIVSAIFQTPAGLMADRVGPFVVLVCGLALEGAAFALAGAVHSYWFMVAMFGVAGLANTVFHPCDYALLSHHVGKERVGRAFSIHTFSGMLGTAIAPSCMLAMQAAIGWRGCFVVAGLAGIAVALALLLQRGDYAEGPHLAAGAGTGGATLDKRALLASPAIVRAFVFYALLAGTGSGLQNYFIVAQHDLFGTPADVASTALTGNLVLTAIGVLAGGLVVTRTHDHTLVTVCGIAVAALPIFVIAMVDPGAMLLLALMSVSGFASGIVMPSRDMLVRAVTPPGAFGTVFGFVTTGFNVAGVVFPLGFGLFMDHGNPRAVFVVSALCALAALATVASGRQKPAVAAS